MKIGPTGRRRRRHKVHSPGFSRRNGWGYKDVAASAALMPWLTECPKTPDAAYGDSLRANIRFVDESCYFFSVFSTGTASSGDSKAIKRTQGTLLAQYALWGFLAGPYA